MGLFSIFRRDPRKKAEEEARKRAEREDLEIYSGMRVEVTSSDGHIFLVAKLIGLRGDRAQLQPVIEGSLLEKTEEPVVVTMRGYSSKESRAVLLEGTLRPGPGNSLQLEHLVLVKRSNDRAFFRVDTNIDAGITPMGSFSAEEEPCKLLNISVGGAYIQSKRRYNVGDRFVLRVKLLPKLEPSMMFCQILRIIERRHDYFEYGCRFSQLSTADEEQILQIIFDLQRKKRQV